MASMGISIDTGELSALADSARGGGRRVGARAAAVHRKATYDVENRMKAEEPVDTGAMRNSTSSTFTGDGRFGTVSSEIGPTVDYAIFVHDGTSVLAPNPFAARAFDAVLPGFEKAVQAIGGEIFE